MYKFYCLCVLTAFGLAGGGVQIGPDTCVLPEYPAHSTYTVHNRPEAVPGKSYDDISLTVTCDPGYGVVGSNITFCDGRNGWREPMPRCSRFCRLTQDPSVSYSCKVTGDGVRNSTRICHELEPHGTVVVPECKSSYYSSGVLLDMHCDEGTWDHAAVCKPDCGISTPKGEQLIIHGTRAKHGELPWHAGIYDKSSTPFMQICGGSLISTKVVVSAAHCFWKNGEGQQPASRYAVALGKIYRPWNEAMDFGAHMSNVSEIKIPARYMGVEGRNQDDIALVIMSTPVVYATYIRPICVDFSVELDRKQLQNSNLGKVSGWGLSSADGIASQTLLTTELQYVEVEKCMVDVPVGFRPYITSDKICAGGNGTAVCRGDSGGGLVFPNEEQGTRRYYLRGVVSTAPTSEHRCNANSYTSFTHIMHHATFIKDHGLGDNSVDDGQVHVGGCILPEYPPHGTYSVHNKPGAAPGQAYDTVLLTVTCDPGYEVIGSNFTFCYGRSYWMELMPQCSRFCNATPDESVNYRCKMAGDHDSDMRMCNEFEPNGTIVVPRCNGPKYQHPCGLADIHCMDGSWDYVAVCKTELDNCPPPAPTPAPTTLAPAPAAPATAWPTTPATARPTTPATPRPTTPRPAPQPQPGCALAYDPQYGIGDPYEGYRFGTRNDSRIEYAMLPGRQSDGLDLTVTLRTFDRHGGLLFYASAATAPEQFLAIYMKDARLHFTFNCGGETALVVSPDTYNNTEWHTVTVIRTSGHGKMTVDSDRIGEASVNCFNPAALTAPFYYGGLQSLGERLSRHLSDFYQPFKGCLKGLMMNGQYVTEVLGRVNSLRCSDNIEEGVYFGPSVLTNETNYLKLQEYFRVGISITVSMEIKPRNSTGLLLSVHGRIDFLVLELLENEVVVNVDNGQGPFHASCKLPDQTSLCDGNWHKIKVVKERHVVSVGVDGHFSNAGLGASSGPSTDTRSALFIGGHERNVSRVRGVRSKRGFNGCIRNIEIRASPMQIQLSAARGDTHIGVCPTD